MRVGIDLLHTKSFTLVVCLCIWSVRKTAELDRKGLRGCDCTGRVAYGDIREGFAGG